MKDLFLIALGAGLQDGLSPCVFMACLVFIAYDRWFTVSPLFVNCMCLNFGLVYVLGILVFNFTPAQTFVLQKYFIITVKIMYLLLGMGAFILGLLFLKDWFMLGRRIDAEAMTGKKIKISSIGAVFVTLMMIILAVVLSASATLWPVDKYILALGNLELSRGEWYSALPLVIAYSFISMWPLWLVWVFINVRNLRTSMLKIVSAAISFTASSCMIFIFK